MELRNNSASGSDGLSSLCLKNGGSVLNDKILEILELSVDNGIFPSKLKLPWISPLWKGESRALAKNYRPVSLVSNLLKVLEKIIRKQMVKFLTIMNYMILVNMVLEVDEVPSLNC